MLLIVLGLGMTDSLLAKDEVKSRPRHASELPGEPPLVPVKPSTVPDEPALVSSSTSPVVPETLALLLKESLPTSVAAMKQEAVTVARQILTEFPASAQAAVAMGKTFERFHGIPEAVDCWQQCLRLDPQHADAYGHLGKVAFEKGEFDRAVELWRKALDIHPSRPGSSGRLGKALMELGKAEEALEAFEKEAIVSPDSSDNLTQLGQVCLQLNEYEKAVEALQRAVAMPSTQPQAWYALAIAYARLENAEQAKHCREQFAARQAEIDAKQQDARHRRNSRTRAARLLAETHVDAGRICGVHRLWGQAEQHWRRAASLDPNNQRCREELAGFYLLSRRLEPAVEVSRQLTEISPNHAIYQFRLGTLLARMRRYDDAAGVFQKGIDLAPKQPVGYRQLITLLLVGNGDLDRAKVLADRLVELAPSARHHALLADVCRKLGDHDGATAAMARAVNLEPANEQYARIHRYLQSRK